MHNNKYVQIPKINKTNSSKYKKWLDTFDVITNYRFSELACQQLMSKPNIFLVNYFSLKYPSKPKKQTQSFIGPVKRLSN